MTGFSIVSTTTAKAEDAKAIARALVTEKLAACVQIMPVGSTYIWQGTLEETAEWLLLCKIRSDDYSLVEAAILALHGYDTPEILATPVGAGFEPFLDWIVATTAR